MNNLYETIDLTQIRHILFDLGGVIYDIVPAKTQAALNLLASPEKAAHIYSKTEQHELVSLYESGKIDTKTFLQGFKEQLGITESEEKIADAWNALLIGLYPHRLEQLDIIRAKYPTALLSNTNELHFQYIQAECEAVYAKLDRCFFSFQIGMRKPNHDIYEYVLKELGWKAEETLFVEDSPQNVVAAREVGMKVWWVQFPEDFDKLLTALSEPK